jgi:hypothetical protein
MPRPARPWFRFYVEAVGDRKLRRLTPAQRWIWTAILAAARESPVAGQLYVAVGMPMTHAELADYAGVKEREILPVIEAMTAMSSLATTDEGVVVVLNFNNRQYESDNVTKRTRTHRERSKERSNNVPENVGRNAPETETETETELNTSTAVGLRNAAIAKRTPDPPAGALADCIRRYVQAAPEPPSTELQTRIERSARSLIAQGFDPAKIALAAENAGREGWHDLAVQLQRDAARASPVNGKRGTADQRALDHLELSRRLEGENA